MNTTNLSQDSFGNSPKGPVADEVHTPEISVVLQFSDGYKVTTSYPWAKRLDAFKQFETYLMEGKNASIVKS